MNEDIKGILIQDSVPTPNNPIRIRKLLVNKEAEEYITNLQNKYNKALELLSDFNMPCENDDFMDIHSDYCEKNCSVDNEIFKKCWDKFIEWKIKDE